LTWDLLSRPWPNNNHSGLKAFLNFENVIEVNFSLILKKTKVEGENTFY